MKLDEVTARYARVLQRLVVSGTVVLFATFVLYVTGAIPSAPSAQEVTRLWHLDAKSYAEQTGRPVGWGRLEMFSTGEGLAFASLLFFALCSIVCLIAVAPLYARKRDYRYLTLVVVQTVVLAAGAAGVLVAR